MITKQAKNKQEATPCILRHLTKWRPIYELAAVVGVVVAIIFGGISIMQTQKSLDVAISSLTLSNKSVEMQEKEFILRNRPIIVIGSYRFGGPNRDSNGNEFARSLKVHLTNISDIPATQVEGTLEVKLNGSTIGITAVGPTATAKSTVKNIVVGLSDDLYREAKKSTNTFEAIVELTYSGMLGEKVDQYMTRIVSNWSSTDEIFMNKETLYK